MKVVYQTCCGVDVHKSFLVATIIKTTSGIEPSYQKKRFSTFNNSILQFKDWLIKNQCRDVCMESTGKYWVPVFNLLEDEINVTIATVSYTHLDVYKRQFPTPSISKEYRTSYSVSLSIHVADFS